MELKDTPKKMTKINTANIEYNNNFKTTDTILPKNNTIIAIIIIPTSENGSMQRQIEYSF